MTRWRGPTVRQLAAETGLSTATVDRVLNKRGTVSADGVARVEAALRRLRPSGERSSSPATPSRLRIGMVCVSGTSFCGALRDAIASLEADAGLSFDVVLQSTFAEEPDALARTLDRVGRRADGLVLVAWDDPAINEAVRRLTADGIPVICLTTDLPSSGRTAYVGMDQTAAGCNAGFLLGRLARENGGGLALFFSAPFRCQEEREMGFRRVLRTDFPMAAVQERQNSHDDPDVAYAATRALLAQADPLIGIYNVAGGNSGIVRALSELPPHTAPALVAHELTGDSRRMMQNGQIDVLLHHDIEAELRDAVSLIRAARDPGAPAATDRITAPTILTRYLL